MALLAEDERKRDRKRDEDERRNSAKSPSGKWHINEGMSLSSRETPIADVSSLFASPHFL